jgi:membrane protein
MPNTRVKVRSAFLGGIVAGVLWNTLGWGFAAFVASSSKYTAIYSTFATLIVFLIWLHIAWLILLIGSSIAFYHQRPEYLVAQRQEIKVSNRVREKLALLVMSHIARAYYASRPPWTADGLAVRLMAPAEATDGVLAALEKAGHIVRTAQEPPGYVPARPPETTEVESVIAAVRAADEDAMLPLSRLPGDAGVDGLIADLERAAQARIKGRTVRDLAGVRAADLQRGPVPSPASPPG